MSKDACLLSRSDISVISENDHRVGLCLCKFCSCGQHSCPSSRRTRTPPPAYSTSYQNSYPRKAPGVASKPAQQPAYKPNQHKMDLETCHMREYRTFTVERPTEELPRALTPTLKFTSYSSYAADFPNWGNVESNVERRPQLPPRGDEVRFMGRSMYQTNFKEREGTAASPVRARPTTAAIYMGPGTDEVMATTAQTSYRPFRNDQMSSIVKRPIEPYIKTTASPVHFTSINRSSYQPRSCEFKDPKLIRRQILRTSK